MSSADASPVLAGAVELAERERALVRAADWDMVAEVSAERARHVAGFPALAGAGDRVMLERLQALEKRALRGARARRAGRPCSELGSLRRGRGAMQGYGRVAAPSAGRRGGWIDHAA